MKATDLRGRSVVAIENAERLGKVEEVLIDTERQTIAAIELASRAGEMETIPVQMIRAIGSDAITVETGGGARAELTPQRRRRGPDEAVQSLGDLLGSRVLTYDGNHIGDLSDVDFDPSSFRITGYEITAGPLADLFGRRKRVPATPDVHFGRKLMTVPEVAHAEPGRAEPSGESTEHGEEARRESRPG